MGFNIAAKPTFRRTVKVRVPDGDGERVEECKATFRALTTAELEKFNLGTAEGTSAFLRAAIQHLDDLTDGNGRAVTFSPEALNAVLDQPWARVALASTYFTETVKAAEGN